MGAQACLPEPQASSGCDHVACTTVVSGADGVAAGAQCGVWNERRERRTSDRSPGRPVNTRVVRTALRPHLQGGLGVSAGLSDGVASLCRPQGGGGFLKDRSTPAGKRDGGWASGRGQTAPLPSKAEPHPRQRQDELSGNPRLYWLKALLRRLVGWDWTFQGGHSQA